MAKRRMVKRRAERYSIDSFEGSLKELVLMLSDDLAEYGQDAYCVAECGEWSDESDVVIYYETEETDKELERRLKNGRDVRAKNKIEKEKKETRELKELKRLQKKYG